MVLKRLIKYIQTHSFTHIHTSDVYQISQKLFISHIMAPHMNIYHDMMSHTLLTCKSHASHTEGAGKQVIIMNYMVFEL